MKLKEKRAGKRKPASLEKIPSGINGLDEITDGGLPKGRPVLVCGSAGCGKTLMSLEFLVRGATEYGEPGVFMAFEETEEELAKNVASLGFDLEALADKKKIAIDYIRIERSEIHETGEFGLEGLFVRLNHAIDSIGAKRVVLDTIEALFAGLPNEAILRAELRRLFRWLKDKGVTAIITAERGQGALTRHGLEEYVADCVILLDHRINNQISTRRLRVVKYRGTVHGTNEYPFLIGKEGISVLPITSLGLNHPATAGRVSSGIPRLDTMFGGKGYFRGSSILVSGTAGSGKSSIAAAFIEAAARRGEKSMYFAFEESPSQIMRNMRSIGIDLEPWVKKGSLHFHAARPSLHGLEMHLLTVHDQVRKIKPRTLVIDPITNLINAGNEMEVTSMLTRLIDFFKTERITAVFNSLTPGDSVAERSEVGVSSLMDTWLLLQNLECAGERNRVLYIMKSRGMKHSNQVREFVMSDKGIDLLDVYTGDGTVLTGSARMMQQSRDEAERRLRQQETERRGGEIERERRAIEAQIQVLQAGLDAKIKRFKQETVEESIRRDALAETRLRVAGNRMADRADKFKTLRGEARNGNHL
jgi:circadian clock protein KaiC